MSWTEYAKFYLNKAPQRSKEWEEARSNLALTSSNFGKVHMYMEGKGERPNLTAKVEMNEAMKLGNKLEPYLRNWFQTQSGYLEPGSVVQEIGLAMPKFYTKIGGSTDGLIVTNGKATGLLEIKTTAKIPQSLLTREGGIPDKYIPVWHYDQMQGCMAILDLGYCYYLVYEHTTNTMHVEKVLRNPEYWNNLLFPLIVRFIENNN